MSGSGTGFKAAHIIIDGDDHHPFMVCPDAFAAEDTLAQVPDDKRVCLFIGFVIGHVVKIGFTHAQLYYSQRLRAGWCDKRLDGGLYRYAVIAVFYQAAYPAFWGDHCSGYFNFDIVFIAGLINAVFAKNFDDISIIPTFVLTPLTYLGGVFYSVSLLPEFWQKVSLLNPVLYMVNAFRYGLLGVSDIAVSTAFLMLSLMIAGLFFFAMYLLKNGKNLRS